MSAPLSSFARALACGATMLALAACGSPNGVAISDEAGVDTTDAKVEDAPEPSLFTDGDTLDGALDTGPKGPVYDAGGPLTHASGDCDPPCGPGEFCWVVNISGGAKAPVADAGSSDGAASDGGASADAGKSLGCHALPPQCQQQSSCNCLAPQLLPYCTSNGGFASETCFVEEDGILHVTCNIAYP